MTSLTIKNANTIGSKFISAQGTRDTVLAILDNVYKLHLNGDEKATKFIVALWESIASDKKALASLRTMFNRVSKKINKAEGISEKACTVKDGKIVEVTPRNKSGKGGQGEGETADNGSSVETIKADSLAKYKLAMRQLESMLKAEKDEKKAEALDVALNLLASKCA